MERTWFDFQKLEIYKKSQEYYMNNKRIVSQGKPMLFAIDQLLRSAHSVVLNIAEGLEELHLQIEGIFLSLPEARYLRV